VYSSYRRKNKDVMMMWIYLHMKNNGYVLVLALKQNGKLMLYAGWFFEKIKKLSDIA
jgi:hypothetical protein